MSAAKTGVLIVNLGTPDSPSVSDVRKYLKQFLNDPRVIDIHPIARWLLVNLIIVPFRSPKSAKIYKELWTENGSPLLIYGNELVEKVQQVLGEKYKVVLGMRYQNPSLELALDQLLDKGFEKIIVYSLFPQYASASTGSAYEEIMRLVSKRQVIPEIEFVGNYFDHPQFIQSFVTLAKPYLDNESYDHVLFSYHGLPERQIKSADCSGACLTNDQCCAISHTTNHYCYRANCFATTRALVKALGLEEGKYTTSFQSRLGRDPWIKPYSDKIIEKFPKKGIKRVLVLVPSFVADCLETTIEVGQEYKELFLHNGGEHWQMVESLNASPQWIKTVAEMIKKRD